MPKYIRVTNNDIDRTSNTTQDTDLPYYLASLSILVEGLNSACGRGKEIADAINAAIPVLYHSNINDKILEEKDRIKKEANPNNLTEESWHMPEITYGATQTWDIIGHDDRRTNRHNRLLLAQPDPADITRPVFTHNIGHNQIVNLRKNNLADNNSPEPTEIIKTLDLTLDKNRRTFLRHSRQR